jgi:hypothetical protein
MMKLIFAGTPEFAAVALDALHASGHEIALVLTQPDRPAASSALIATRLCGHPDSAVAPSMTLALSLSSASMSLLPPLQVTRVNSCWALDMPILRIPIVVVAGVAGWGVAAWTYRWVWPTHVTVVAVELEASQQV